MRGGQFTDLIKIMHSCQNNFKANNKEVLARVHSK